MVSTSPSWAWKPTRTSPKPPEAYAYPGPLLPGPGHSRARPQGRARFSSAPVFDRLSSPALPLGEVLKPALGQAHRQNAAVAACVDGHEDPAAPVIGPQLHHLIRRPHALQSLVARNVCCNRVCI